MKIPLDLINKLRDAKHITVLTGAGISAESGVPTFRQAQTGLWSKYDPEELATPQSFKANPALVWNWYKWRQEIIYQADPNPGHIALADMEKIASDNNTYFILITQNVDGLHQLAGTHNIIELHGNIHQYKCFDCGEIPECILSNPGVDSHCTICGGSLRPDVVWFGENIPTAALQSSWKAAQDCDIFFSIGTSAFVQPAASLPLIALQNSATVIEINTNETPITTVATYHFQAPSGEILPKIIASVWKTKK